MASRSGHEASIQDLRATNEELQSINEEYRSTAEELETSKEELQSINEELHTVNAELKSKLSSISVAHSDLQNLTASTEIGTLFLDVDLRIKMYTPPITDLFNITKADTGRRITDFSHRLDYRWNRGGHATRPAGPDADRERGPQPRRALVRDATTAPIARSRTASTVPVVTFVDITGPSPGRDGAEPLPRGSCAPSSRPARRFSTA